MILKCKSVELIGSKLIYYLVFKQTKFEKHIFHNLIVVWMTAWNDLFGCFPDDVAEVLVSCIPHQVNQVVTKSL